MNRSIATALAATLATATLGVGAAGAGTTSTASSAETAQSAASCPSSERVKLRKGKRGIDSVRELQCRLNILGYGLKVDAVFGTSTDKAVRAFQKSAGLKVDGVVGDKTWAALVARTGGASAPDANPHPAGHTDGRTLSPRTKHVRKEIEESYPSITCIYYKGGQDHADGNAIDCHADKLGRKPSASAKADMQSLATWSVKYASRLKVQYVMWDREIWNISRADEGWRDVRDRGGITANHEDHVHVSVQN